MEATFKKKSSPDNAQENNKDKRQRPNAGKTGDNKSWWEQLTGDIPEDKDEQNNWYKRLTHPLAIIAGLIMLGYWWFNQKQKHYDQLVQENEELKNEVSRLQKKCKKLKKQNRVNAAHNVKSNRFAVLD